MLKKGQICSSRKCPFFDIRKNRAVLLFGTDPVLLIVLIAAALLVRKLFHGFKCLAEEFVQVPAEHFGALLYDVA